MSSSCHNPLLSCCNLLKWIEKMILWKKLKTFDHYRRAAFSMLPISFALIFYLMLVQGDGFLLPEWFLDLIIVPAFAGNLLSGSTYIGRSIDLVPQVLGIKEKIATWIGIGVGIAVGVAATILHESIPLVSSLSGVANVVFTLSQISVFAGFGNRIGSSLDKSRLPNEQKAIGAASLIGIATGLALFLTSSVALVSVVGITSFVTMGAAIPFWLGGVLFVTTFSSSLASFADYSAKAFNFVKSKSMQDEKTKQRVKERFHEYRGSFCGVSAGFIVGSLIVGALLVTQPHIFVGVLGVIAATLVITTSMSVLGGLCSRVGRLMDGFKQKKGMEAPNEKLISSPARTIRMLNENKPDMRPHLVSAPIPIPAPKRPARASEAGLYRPSSLRAVKETDASIDKRFIFGSA
jgi:hypothetical protein